MVVHADEILVRGRKMSMCNCKYPLSQVLEACQVQGVGMWIGELLGLIPRKGKRLPTKKKAKSV